MILDRQRVEELFGNLATGRQGVVLAVRNVLVDGDQAVVELDAVSTQNNGKPFANQYCWVCRFSGGKIVEVRAYLDSALVTEAIEGNEGP